MENKLKIRVLSLTAILLAIVAALSFYQVSQIGKLPGATKFPSQTPAIATSSGAVQVVGPGGCVGIDQCLKYCQDHPEKCSKKSP